MSISGELKRLNDLVSTHNKIITEQNSSLRQIHEEVQKLNDLFSQEMGEELE